MAKVLIIEDDDVIASSMAQHLSTAGFDPVTVGRGEVGLARLRYEAPEVVVLDLMLPGLDGWKLIESARAEGIGTPRLRSSSRRRPQRPARQPPPLRATGAARARASERSSS